MMSSKRNRQMPRRSQYSDPAVFERAKKRWIREQRRRKRRLRRIVKTAILAVMGLLVLLIGLGIGFGIRAIVRRFSSDTVTESVLAERSEAMPDLSEIVIPEATVEPIDLYICIDPGHGGIDPGTNVDGRTEKDDVLTLGLALRDELESKGVQVLMTRDDDTFLTLSERGVIANDANVDYFVSLHRNGVDKEEAGADPQGVEIYVPIASREKTPESYKLAENIMDAMEEAGISQARGIRYGSQSSENFDLQVNRDTSMPSCLIEVGFLSNEEDNYLLDEHMEDYAEAMADAIIKTSGKGKTSTVPEKGLVLSNAKIQDVDTLNNEEIVWAPGSQTDDTNRPAGAIEFQQKYGSYQAKFLEEDAQDEIYLTFDVGYQADYTEEILDILKEKKISAVFFITLPFAQTNPELVWRMIDEGHIIGNHSAYNPKKGIAKESLEDQKDSVKELHDYMSDTFHYNMCLFRFPNGRFSEQSLAMVNNLNYESVFWSFSYDDYESGRQPDRAQALTTMTNCLHNGAIYLLSARSKTNADVLDDFIDETGLAGYTFGIYSVTSTATDSDEGNETDDSNESDGADADAQTEAPAD